MSQQKKTHLVLLAMLGLTALVMLWSLSVGSAQVGLPWQGWHALDDTQRAIFLQIRLPRVMQAFAVGGLLAMSGLIMQVLLRNPLADPYILGLSAGAGLGGVTVAALLGGVASAAWVQWLPSVGAALGAGVVAALVFGLNARQGLQTLDRLLLTGVAFSALCSALVSLLLTFVGQESFRGLVFWLLGELHGENALPLLLMWAAALLLGLPLARTLNALALGDELAHSVGVSTPRVRTGLYWFAAVSTGVAVAAGGMIGFVGLVVPHALRLLLGADNRLLWPAVALAGGVFLTAADAVARTVMAPVVLPVGVVTALAGSPVFLWLLHRQLRAGTAHIQRLLSSSMPSGDDAIAANPSPTPLIETRQLNLTLADRTLCQPLDWQAQGGQVWAVIGNSGVGKSTLLKALAGLENTAVQHAGQVAYRGQTLANMPVAQRACHVAWMPQTDQTGLDCTVQQRVLAGLYPHGRPLAWESRRDLVRVESALQQVGLFNMGHRTVRSLSGGEARRVALAAAFVQGTSVVLLDEPLSQLDWKLQMELGALIQHWAHTQQGVAVWVTHDPNLAARFSTHVLAVCSQGKVVQGLAHEVLQPSVLTQVYGCPVAFHSNPPLLFPTP